MFTNHYFTEEDARAVQAIIALMFPEIQFNVHYQGIYGAMGTPGKLAYWLMFDQYNKKRWINNFESLTQWLTQELDAEQAEQVASLIHQVATESQREE